MNRLRNRKKAKEEEAAAAAAAAPRPSVDTESPGTFKMFGRSKKPVEEPKPEIDLASALPSTDDFRTSLLMTGLSNRFSMLREQDDPTSKLGKSFDDSVLQPRRQSRMDFLGPSGLDDIAEVSSLRKPSMPGRIDSFQSSDDAASTNGSLMGRSKPTEGNNLFGGRQKIYKITSSGTGRALYDDDVAQSAFQKWRQSEKEAAAARLSLEESDASAAANDLGASSQPDSNDFNRRRETSSTTSSVPSAARNSTAATSIASAFQRTPSLKDWQPPSAAGSASGNTGGSSTNALPNAAAAAAHIPERSVTRTRRLYEQSLHQDLHDHQSSALSRIDTLSRNRTTGSYNPGNRTPDLPCNGGNGQSPTVGAFSAVDMARRSVLSKGSAPNLRSSTSTTISAFGQPSPTIDGGNGAKPLFELRRGPSPVSGGPAGQQNASASLPPLSPPISETGEYPSMSIGANDRGKATALGFFSRPAGQYDENRYAQRQRQLQQGRETPPTTTGRNSAGSNVSADANDGSRSSSSINRAPVADAVASPTRATQPTVRETGEARRGADETSGATFLDTNDDDEDDDYMSLAADAAPYLDLPPQLTLNLPIDEDDGQEFRPSLGGSNRPSPLTLTPDNASTVSGKGTVPDEDSPTLGPASGLSGMVRQHLRHDSAASSIYGATADSSVADNDSQAPYEYGKRPQDRMDGSRSVGASSSLWGAEPAQHASKQPDEEDTEDFARHLAEGARRVRERLTSYADMEHSRSSSPNATRPQQQPDDDLPPPQTGNAYEALRPRSSRSSMADREHSRQRTPFSAASPPLQHGSKAPFDDTPPASDPAAKDDGGRRSSEQSSADGGKGNALAGLKAFRQARRELQKMKEPDSDTRRKAPPPPMPQKAPPPPPVSYNNNNNNSSRPGSRAASERDRSGSEASNSGQPYRLPRVRAGSSARDAQQQQQQPPPPLPLLQPRAYSPTTATAPSPTLKSPLVRPAVGGGMTTMSASSPGMHSPMGLGPAANSTSSHPSAPPPLPPINPRRKSPGSWSQQDPLPSPTTRLTPTGTSTPDFLGGGGRSPRATDDTANAPAQSKQRLRRMEPSPSSPRGWDASGSSTRGMF
ncbi:hypothetical protein GMORB2_7054 [Geosmithia morbida]|uniref:Uncharacterized protein n=1 Tax=Geosmithia morbida TaxID=1094350 RepID=A0A9P5D1H2_9HYPO|nr:uncharacterized protein GMORB2_7054 [Geosmithia morbida]KAF4122747.1 hypothetical protein GMORB2_7054 [Geosmithia morbida]